MHGNMSLIISLQVSIALLIVVAL